MISLVSNNPACQRQANDPTDRLGGEDVSVALICVLECGMNSTNELNRKHCAAVLDSFVAPATRASAELGRMPGEGQKPNFDRHCRRGKVWLSSS